MADVQVVRLAHVAHSTPVFAALYKDVNNAAFLRKQLVEANADYEYAFLDASVILSCKHIFAAVFRAINDKMATRLKSRNIHSEIVFSLSPNNNIAESFRRFGISDNTKNLLAVKVSTDPSITQASVMEHLSTAIEGIPVELNDENLAEFTNLMYLKKVYKLGNEPNLVHSTGKYNEAEQTSLDRFEEKRRLMEYMESVILGIIALKGW